MPAQFQYPVLDQCRLSVPFWPNAGGVGPVSVPRLGPVPAKCLNCCRCDCGPMPAVLTAGLGPVYLGRFWGVIHPMSRPSLATAAGPSYFFRPAGVLTFYPTCQIFLPWLTAHAHINISSFSHAEQQYLMHLHYCKG